MGIIDGELLKNPVMCGFGLNAGDVKENDMCGLRNNMRGGGWEE